jgi:hypothetical protein
VRMRKVAIVVAAGLFLVASAAVADTVAQQVAKEIPQQIPHRHECVRLTMQMERYARDAGWAADRGNELWEQASVDQWARLAARRKHLCPSLYHDPLKEYADLLGKAAQLAAKAAVKYFTGGWL